MRLMIFHSLTLFIVLLSSFFAHTETETFSHTYTKAICEGNRCADYFVVCNNQEIYGVQKITADVVFDNYWEDLRTEEEKEIRC